MLAKMGAAVFSYDMWAWGESALAFKLKDHRSDLGIVMQTWQSIRILDYLCAQPWADTTRVGVTGASGGGTQTMVIAALDDRITLSVPGGHALVALLQGDAPAKAGFRSTSCRASR